MKRADPDTTFRAGRCWVDGKACEVTALFAANLPVELMHDLCEDERAVGERGAASNRADRPSDCAQGAWSMIARHLPCASCRGVERQVRDLGRLGCHERRLLLAAPPPDGEAQIVEASDPGRAGKEAHGRATRRLVQMGLLDIGRTLGDPVLDELGWVPRRWQRTVRLTPLGHAIVQRVGESLARGRRVRWSAHRAALLASLRLPAAELLVLLRARLARATEGARELESLVRQFVKLGALDTAAARTGGSGYG